MAAILGTQQFDAAVAVNVEKLHEFTDRNETVLVVWNRVLYCSRLIAYGANLCTARSCIFM